jgi:hypothetical protein
MQLSGLTMRQSELLGLPLEYALLGGGEEEVHGQDRHRQRDRGGT